MILSKHSLRKYVVFVSGPLTHGDTTENVKAAHEAGLELHRAGFSVIIPHDSVFWGNSTCVVRDDKPDQAFLTQKDVEGTHYHDWLDSCFSIISRCDAVLRLPGTSPGADKEVKHAIEHDILVFYSVKDLINYYEWLQKVKLGG